MCIRDSIRAQQFVEVRARVEGYLENMLCAEGTYVTKNQVLFVINQDQYRAKADKARAQLKNCLLYTSFPAFHVQIKGTLSSMSAQATVIVYDDFLLLRVPFAGSEYIGSCIL